MVRDGAVLGEGFHARYGEAHAERNALAACTADPRGATLYVSLEPCCHHGHTPPCTDAILEAGIRRVVVASDDPTEKASGRGLGILRDEGVEVVVADGEPAMRARLLNQAFRKHARTGRPHVLFKSAMTLDGKVATRTGDSKWISGEAVAPALAPLARRARRRRRRHRHGARRRPAAQRPRSTASPRQPRRVVFDSEGRLPLDSQLVRGAPELPLTVVVGRAASRLPDRRAGGRRRRRDRRHGRERARARALRARPARRRRHHARSCSRAARGSRARSSTRARSTRSACSSRPVVVGGSSARDPLEGEGAERIAEATRALALEVERIGDDVLISARMREW